MISKVLDMDFGNFTLRIIAHFILTSLAVLIAYLVYPISFLDDWKQGIISFLIIYLLIWIGFRIWIYLDVTAINEQVKRRKNYPRK